MASGLEIEWESFQLRVALLLEEFPTLRGLVPKQVSSGFRERRISILDLLVEVAERVLPGASGVLTADERALDAEHLAQVRAEASEDVFSGHIKLTAGQMGFIRSALVESYLGDGWMPKTPNRLHFARGVMRSLFGPLRLKRMAPTSSTPAPAS